MILASRFLAIRDCAFLADWYGVFSVLEIFTRESVVYQVREAMYVFALMLTAYVYPAANQAGT